MANEYLSRTPTTNGNRRTFTWSGWVKKFETGGGFGRFFESGAIGDRTYFTYTDTDALRFSEQVSSSNREVLITDARIRDTGSFYHVMIAIDSTQESSIDRSNIYINGVKQSELSTDTRSSLDVKFQHNEIGEAHYIGNSANQAADFQGIMSDVFMVDGLALTPDVFGYHKEGDGYVSVGTTTAVNFKRGQWIPKSPKVIKSAINAKGGFGPNGYYLPMNDSTNIGIDFHCDLDTIIKLAGEDLPQPTGGLPNTTDSYVSELREDPFKEYLSIAYPFVSGGLNSGYGDYAPSIKGSGDQLNPTFSGTNNIGVTSCTYGSAARMLNASNTGMLISWGTRDPKLDFGAGDFTMECWVYPSKQASSWWAILRSYVYDANPSDESEAGLSLYGNTTRINLWDWHKGSPNDLTGFLGSIPTQQWTHVAVDRHDGMLRTYLNGLCVDSQLNHREYNNDGFEIGNNYPWDGYISDVRIYKGVAKYKGGFEVPNHYTPIGITTWRSVSDNSKNNFATLNTTAAGSKYTITEGSLRFTNSTSNWTGFIEGTVGFSTGKWYWETRADVDTDYHHIGIVGVGITHHDSTDTYRYAMSYQSDGRFYGEDNNTSTFATGKTHANLGDIVQVAVDMNDKKMWIGINGNWIDSGDPATGTTANFNTTVGFGYQHYVPFYDSYGSSGLSMNFGQNPTFGGKRTAGTNTDDNGRGLFSYDVPEGYLALCEDNLPTPAISDPGKHFKTVLWTGDGNSSHSITGVGFKPDFVWFKQRTGSGFYHQLYDSVRGPAKVLFSNDTLQEYGRTNGLMTFDSDGFSLGNHSQTNASGQPYVAWCWKVGGSSNTFNVDGTGYATASAAGLDGGTINPTGASVSTETGFSILTYQGNGTAGANIAHGLSKAPELMIHKSRQNSRNWYTITTTIDGSPDYLYLNSTTGALDSAVTAPTSDLMYFTSSVESNATGEDYTVYMWHSVESFSKFGSYVGNGNADGPFVYCGFKPAWVMYKRTDTTGNWAIVDSSRNSTNPSDLRLFADTSGVESDLFSVLDFVSNGFKFRTDASSTNGSGATYIFAAFAESPFTTANAK